MPSKPRPCWVCGEQTLVKNVAEERRVFPKGEYQIMCKTCMKKKIEAAIAQRRKELGLP